MAAVVFANPTPADNEGGKYYYLKNKKKRFTQLHQTNAFRIFQQESPVQEINVNVSSRSFSVETFGHLR